MKTRIPTIPPYRRFLFFFILAYFWYWPYNIYKQYGYRYRNSGEDMFANILHKKIIPALVCACVLVCAAPPAVWARDTARIIGIPTQNLLGDAATVTRAQAAKMLAFIEYSQSEIDGLTRVITFGDVSLDNWYDRYVNAAFTAGYMTGYGDQFRPEQPVTLQEASAVLGKIDKKGKLAVKLTDDNKNKPISFALWNQLYIELLADLSGKKPTDAFSGFGPDYGMALAAPVMLATPGSNNKLPAYNGITDSGPVTFYGLDLDAYIDRRVDVIMKGGEIITPLALNSASPTLANAYIARVQPGTITVFIGGAQRAYRYDNAVGAAEGGICDITVSGGRAADVTPLRDSFTDTVKAGGNGNIEFAGRGVIPIGADFRVYSVADGLVKWKSLSNITPGADGIMFVTRGGKLAAAVILKTPSLKTVRVALNTTGFTGLYHKTVSLTATTAFTIDTPGGTKSYKANQTVNIADSMFDSRSNGGGRIYVRPSGNGETVLKSVKRGGDNHNPAYRGVIEIAKTPSGYVIDNELSMEQYLYSVLPSEMPTKFGAEAMKVQAVAARSYAVCQIDENRYALYGANVDDSTSCQVYNNVPENSVSVAAADATAGECLTYGGGPVSTNFFSTSCGMTANSGEIWPDPATGQFPAATAPYMTAQPQFDAKNAAFKDLSAEGDFDKFITDKKIGGYDSAFPWFRWSVSMTPAEAAASINAEIQNRYKINPKLILTLQDDGTYRSAPVSDIGNLKDLSVVKRGAGGNAMEVKAAGTKATVLIKADYNIRDLLAPKQHLFGGKPIVTTQNDGTAVKDCTIMPSAFFMITKTTDKKGGLTQLKFTGGGYGHGVGMSQNGVSAMAAQGHKYRDILSHYYTGTAVAKEY